MAIGLHGIPAAIQMLQAGDSGGAGAHRFQVIDIGRAIGRAEIEQGLTLLAPPGARAGRLGAGQVLADLAPGRTEGLVHRFGLDQLVVQAAAERLALVAIHHHGEIEVIRGLGDETHRIVGEGLHGRAELGEQGAHAPADHGHGGAILDQGDPGDLGEVIFQRRNHVRRQTRIIIKRDRDRGFRSGDQVDGHAMAREGLEGLGQEAGGPPHSVRFHRDQADTILHRYGLEARRIFRRGGGDRGARHVRLVRAQDLHLDPGRAHRRNGARVQDAGAHGGQFLGLLIGKGADLAGSAGQARIGREETRHIGPDLDPLGPQFRREIGTGRVRTAAAEQGGVAIFPAGDEALGDDDVRPVGQFVPQALVPGVDAVTGQIAACARCRDGSKMLAGIQPARGDAFTGQPGLTQRGRHQLALGHDPGLQARAGIAGQGQAGAQARQFVEIGGEQGFALNAQLGGQLQMARLDRVQLGLAVTGHGAAHQRIEKVGDFRDGGMDDKHAFAFRLHFGNPFRDHAPISQRLNAGAAEFQDDPIVRVAHILLHYTSARPGGRGAACIQVMVHSNNR